MRVKYSIIYIVVIAMLVCLIGCVPSQSIKQEGRLSIVTTVFPAYDFAAQICGGVDADIKMLLPLGSESHTYEPTPQDIMTIQNCDLLICVGGESEAWLDTILAALDTPVRIFRMLDCVSVEASEEERSHDDHDNHTHGDHDHDEHIWTSPLNAAAIVTAIGGELCGVAPANAAIFSANAAEYAYDIMELDSEFRELFDTVQNKTLVFGDRFPFKHFADEYGLTCYAAYPGCAGESEPGAAAIAFLIDTVIAENIGTVYYIEFSNHLVADGIAEASGADTALLHSCHNVSAQDMQSGITYISLMRRNLDTLRATMR